jgi:hypothetical protein
LRRALAETATALVPTATWGDIPTRWSSKGVAIIDPPPPTRPSVSPTSEPAMGARRSVT